MNFKIVLFLGLICFASIASTSKVTECLSKIDADDGNVGKYSKAKVNLADKKNTKVEGGRLLQALAESNTLTSLI